MILYRIVAIVFIIALFSGWLKGQDLIEYSIPYGFQTPNLRAGQYIISLWGDYEDLKHNLKSDHNYAIDRRFDVSTMMTAKGTLALTDWVILITQLEYYPRRYVSDQIRSSLFFTTPRLRELQFGSLRPSFELVFKPRPNIEVYGNFDYSYYEYDLHDYDDYFDEVYETLPYWDRSYKASLGITWFGKAW